MQASNVVQEWHTGMTPPESPTIETKSPRENSRKLWKIQESFDHFVNKNRPKPKVGPRKESVWSCMMILAKPYSIGYGHVKSSSVIFRCLGQK